MFALYHVYSIKCVKIQSSVFSPWASFINFHVSSLNYIRACRTVKQTFNHSLQFSLWSQVRWWRNFALMSNFVKCLCLLKAVSGGSGKHSARCWSCTIDRQCLACILAMDGSLGSYLVAKTGLFDALFLCATFLGIFFALLISQSSSLSG